MKPAKHVFILCTGRSGSVSFIRSCQYITNYSAGHETKAHAFGEDRLDFPEYHIEADNRLSWFLGPLEEKFGDDAVYVHLLRNREATLLSFMNRWGQKGGIIYAFEKGILMTKNRRLSKEEKIQICGDYYDTVNANIRQFLRYKSKTLTLRIENMDTDFKEFWDFIGAEGELNKAIAAFKEPANTSQSRKTVSYRIRSFIYHLKTRFK